MLSFTCWARRQLARDKRWQMDQQRPNGRQSTSRVHIFLWIGCGPGGEETGGYQRKGWYRHERVNPPPPPPPPHTHTHKQKKQKKKKKKQQKTKQNKTKKQTEIGLLKCFELTYIKPTHRCQEIRPYFLRNPASKSSAAIYTVYPKKYAHGFCFAVLCCGCTLTDFLISIRLTSPALWQSNDCLSASKATLMNMDKYFMWIHYERLHNHNKTKHNKTVCIFLGIYSMCSCVAEAGTTDRDK